MDMNSYLIFGVIGLLSLVLVATMASRPDDIRIARIERKLDAILKEMGVNADANVPSDVMELVRMGQVIEAIKLYRERTGCGLKEAKDYVDSLR